MLVTGPEFLPTVYAAVSAVEEGKVAEMEVEFDTFDAEGNQTTLRVIVRREPLTYVRVDE